MSDLIYPTEFEVNDELEEYIIRRMYKQQGLAEVIDIYTRNLVPSESLDIFCPDVEVSETPATDEEIQDLINMYTRGEIT